MTGVDTNVLVRFLVDDDEAQTARVHRFLKSSRNTGEPVFVSTVVLCETCWVLRSAYAKSKKEVLEAVESLLNADVFLVEEAESVQRALELSRKGKADFPDYLIGELHLARKCHTTVTFDRSLRGAAAFSVL